MQATFGKPAVKEACEYKPVDIDIKDLFSLNWSHWKQGFKIHNEELDNPDYYIYSILGGIVHLRFNEENQTIVRDYVAKQAKTRFNEAYLAWYDIVHSKDNKVYNVAKAAKVPFFTLNEMRVERTINTELAAENSNYPDTIFSDICATFVKDVKEALAKDAPESIRETHNKFTSFIINHIIKVKCSTPMFVYNTRTVKHTAPDGTETKEEKLCDEIHFIVTYEETTGGRVKVVRKTMPTLPMITGGGRHRSSWTIERILINGEIIGLMDTPIAK